MCDSGGICYYKNNLDVVANAWQADESWHIFDRSILLLDTYTSSRRDSTLWLVAPLLIPGFYSLIHSGRTAGSMPYRWNDFIPSIEIIKMWLLFFLTPHGSLTTFWPIIVLIGILVLVVTYKKHLFFLVLLCVGIVGTTIPVVGGILNGFSYIIDRWSAKVDGEEVELQRADYSFTALKSKKENMK